MTNTKKEIHVNLGPQSYSITIGAKILNELSKHLAKQAPSKKIIFITNPKLARLYKNKIKGHLKGHFNDHWVLIPDGERYKTLKTVEKIYHELGKLEADRKTILVALGGGVVGDITGFVAATYLRGIPFIQIPTSLLAMVDSSVGGKTGVDLPFGKNLVGAFYQPKAVLVDIDFLKTLPQRELLCGLAEVVKYGALWDETLFSFLEQNVEKILKLNPEILAETIARCCSIKAEIVSKDEKESGLRSLLNFGHTLAHAIETVSGYNKILHGEAVSQGMVYAATLSASKKLCSWDVVERLENLLFTFGLPIEWPHYPKNKYEKAILQDKKKSGDKINYVVIREIGKTELMSLTPKEILAYLY